MSAIDTTSIEGYEQMTPEQKIAALEGFNIPDPDYSGYVKKEEFIKTASKLNKMKKQLRERLSEDEAAKQQEEDERERLQAAYDALLRENTVSKHEASLLGLGFDESTSAAIAEALVGNDAASVFANLKKFIDNLKKTIRAEVLQATPTPTPDGVPTAMTLAEFRKLPPEERLDFYVKNPEAYRTIYEGGTV